MHINSHINFTNSYINLIMFYKGMVIKRPGNTSLDLTLCVSAPTWSLSKFESAAATNLEAHQSVTKV